MREFFHRITHKGYVEEYDGTSLITVPNAITLLRLFLLGPISYAIIKQLWIHIFVLALLFFLLDNLDGYLAHCLKQRTRFGATFDKTVDAIATFVGFFAGTVAGMLPFWLFGILASKQLVQVFLAGKLAHRGLRYPPVYLIPGRFGFGTITAGFALMAALTEQPFIKLILCLITGGLLMLSVAIMTIKSLQMMQRSA